MELVPFSYEGNSVRSLSINGDPWFVAADVARVLGYRMASDMTRRLDEDDRGTRSVRTPSGHQDMTVISEAGLYTAVLGSQVEGARHFKRWVTGTVLPQIRRTGSYSPAPALTEDQIVAQALQITAHRVEVLQAQVAELEPRAIVADRMLDASGDLSVADAAKELQRAGLSACTQSRLFAGLERRGWIFRGKGDRKWRVYQRAITGGWMSVLPQSHYHPRTGELVLDVPQPRITPKGIQRYLLDHGVAEYQIVMPDEYEPAIGGGG